MPRIEINSIDKHDGDILALAFYDNLVFSGGCDGKIKIWDKNLNLIKNIDAHDGYIYCLAISSDGKVYSSSSEGNVKYIVPPYENIEVLFRSNDVVQAMYFDNDILLTGDEKGLVTTWTNDKMLFKYNLVEEIKSLACETPLIYTVRDLDVVISEINPGKSGKYSTKAVMEGKSPLSLLGSLVNKKHSFLAFADRSGKGLCLVHNLKDKKFLPLWNMPDFHNMILNTICGDDKYLYSGGYDCKVKGLTNLHQDTPTRLGEIDVGCCINALTCGTSATVFVGGSDGIVRLANFA